MDLVDQFVWDGVFGNHRHEHFFAKAETKAAREAWLREIDKLCRLGGIAYVVKEVKDENDNPGYEFGFADISPTPASS
jgi:hypothetical protein